MPTKLNPGDLVRWKKSYYELPTGAYFKERVGYLASIDLPYAHCVEANGTVHHILIDKVEAR